MKSKFILFVGMMAASTAFAQVGINTNTPEATLDVNGNMMLRAVPVANASTAYDFMVVNPTTHEVQKISGNLTGANVNTTMAKADDRDGVTLLDGSLFAGWQKINFTSPITINPGGHFDLNTDFYTVPSSGVYAVNYEFRYDSGVLLQMLNFSGTPRIGILLHDGSGYSVLDEKTFSGAHVPMLASILISDSSINSIYQLTAGDRLSFEVNEGGLSLGLLPSSRAMFSIYKISD